MTTNNELKTSRAWGEVGATFLKLGLTSFGGPIAHLGYFHREIVERKAMGRRRALLTATRISVLLVIAGCVLASIARQSLG